MQESTGKWLSLGNPPSFFGPGKGRNLSRRRLDIADSLVFDVADEESRFAIQDHRNGEIQQTFFRGTTITGKTGLAGGIAAALLLTGYFGILEGQLDWRTSPGSRKPKVDWQPWSHAAVSKAVGEGRPVLVDFTADGCLNCQLNKRTSIEIKSTSDLIRDRKVVALEGDFTDLDPAIAAELQKYGRRGVPLVLVFSRDPSKAPRVLPTVLTPSVVQEALDWASH